MMCALNFFSFLDSKGFAEASLKNITFFISISSAVRLISVRIKKPVENLNKHSGIGNICFKLVPFDPSQLSFEGFNIIQNPRGHLTRAFSQRCLCISLWESSELTRLR